MLSSNLNVAYLQMDLVWEDWVANASRIDSLLSTLEQPIDLIILPEMFGSGFTLEPSHVAQSMDGQAVAWMSATAASNRSHCMGSLVIEDEGRYYNRLISAGPDGSISFYNKRHLFTYAGESEKYSAGNHRLIETVSGWKVCPLICYDLRFPVWSRNNLDFDLLLFVANWPAPRIEAWRTLLKARAIENQCYVIGVNRVGSDAHANSYPGSSCAYDAEGALVDLAGTEEEIRILHLDGSSLKTFRSQYNFLADRDSYTVQ